MSEGIKDYTLESANEDKFLQRELRKQTGATYQDLSAATIHSFFVTKKPLTWWGKVKTATEEIFSLTSIDFILQINKDLWERLDDDGKSGIVAHLLWQVQAKTGGVTHQRMENGEDRQLYSIRSSTLTIDAEVIARHPQLVEQLDELRRWKSAVDDPGQFLLNLNAPESVAA